MKENRIDLKNLGSLIRSNRVKLALTQADIAEKIGVSTQHYSRIERGEYIPSLQTFLKLVDIFDMDINGLRFGKEENVSSTMYEIVYLLEKFNKTQQKAVLSFLKTMEPATI